MIDYVMQLTDAITEIVESSRDCPNCDATGKEPHTEDDACHECGGAGEYAIVATIKDLRLLLKRVAYTPDPPAWTKNQKKLYHRGISQ